jgi:N-acetyl sugar amidotransferase
MKIGIIDTDHYFYIYTLISLFEDRDCEFTLYINSYVYKRCEVDLPGKKNIKYIVQDPNETWGDFLERSVEPINNAGFDYFFICPIYQDYKEHYKFVSALKTFNILVVFNLNGWINALFGNIRYFDRSWYKHQIIKKVNCIAIDEHFHSHAIKRGYKKQIIHIPSFYYDPEFASQHPPKKSPLKIIVPGTIDPDRRDYHLVLDAVEIVLSQTQDFEISLLGDPIAEYGKQIHIRAKKINDRYGKQIIKYYENRYTDNEFLIERSSGHFLIAPVLPGFYLDGIKEIYGISKSTGSCFDILASAIPGVFPKWLSVNPKFESSILRYENAEQLSGIITNFLNHPDQLDKLRANAVVNSSYYTVEKVRGRLFKDLNITHSAYQMCNRCVMDTKDDPNIFFDELGHCNYCNEYFEDDKKNFKTPQELKVEIDRIIHTIKTNRGKNKYDCIVGVSGGADSMYVVHLLVKYGMRPLVVHYDNGWDSELAVKNIEVVLAKLNIDLFTYVNDWEEFKDLQLSFFKANVIDIELITDQAIIALFYKLSRKYNIKYVFTGQNVSTEFILPKHWYHWKLDGLNIKSIHKKFGKLKLKTYPVVSYFDQYYLNKTNKIQQYSLLNYVEYNKEEAKKILRHEYGWVDYTGKHNESVFTRFYQSYILPLKFKVDKRKAHLSSLICSGQLTRDKALEELKIIPWQTPQAQTDKEYVIKKLGLSEAWFDDWIKTKPTSHLNYPSYLTRHDKIARRLKKLIGR